MNPAKRARIPEVGRGRRLVWRCDNKLGSLRQSNSVWCVANWTGYADLCLWYFGRGFSYARDLKVFMQFVQSWNLSIEVSLPRPAPIFFHVVIDGMTGYGAVGEARTTLSVEWLCHPAFLL